MYKQQQKNLHKKGAGSYQQEQNVNSKKYDQDQALEFIERENIDQDEFFEDEVISKAMKSLADKAYELSMKYDLQQEAELIEQEELKIAKLLKEEKDQRMNITSKLKQDESKFKNAIKSSHNRKNHTLKEERLLKSNAVPIPIQQNISKKPNEKFSSTDVNNYLQQDESYTTNSTLARDLELGSAFGSIQSELILDQAVQRLHEDALRRKEFKERIQLIRAKKELEELRQQPEINKKSMQMTQQKQHVPIHERFQKVILDKTQKSNQLGAQLLQQDMSKNPEDYFPTFQPKINKQSRNGIQQRNFTEFLQDNTAWNNLKHEKYNQQEQQKKNQIKKDCTFKPQINQQTDQLLSQSQKFAETQFLNRLQQYVEIKEKKQQLLQEIAYQDASFKPKIWSKDEKANKFYERKLKKEQEMKKQTLNNQKHSIISPDSQSQTPTFNNSVSSAEPKFEQNIQQSKLMFIHNEEQLIQELESLTKLNHQSPRNQRNLLNSAQQTSASQSQEKVSNVNNHFNNLNEDSFSKPSSQWLFSSQQQDNNSQQENFHNKYGSIYNKEDLQQYLSQLEDKMKQDEQEIEQYEKVLSKNNSLGMNLNFDANNLFNK